MKETVRVLHLLPHGEVGGQERYVQTLCRRLGDVFDDFRLAVCFSLRGVRIAEEMRGEGVRISVLGMRNGFDLARAVKLAALDRRRQIHLVHSHGPLPLLNLVAKLSGVPVQVLTDHGPSLTFSDPRARRRVLFLRALHPLVDRFVAVSSNMAESRVLRERIPAEKVVTLHSGIDVERVRRGIRERAGRALLPGVGPSEGPVVGTVARFVDGKRLDLFLRTCRRMSDRNPHVRFVAAGAGPLLPAMERLASELGLGDRVWFAGERDDVPALLAHMDLLVCTSAGEAFPLSLLEAMAVARPVVAFDVTGVREAVLQGRTGVLVPDGELEGLADACLWILERPVLGREMGRAGLERVREAFDIERHIRKLGLLYRDLLCSAR